MLNPTKDFSMTISGAITMIVTAVAAMFEVDLDPGYVTEIVIAVGFLIGAFLNWYGRVRKGDIYWWGGRK